LSRLSVDTSYQLKAKMNLTKEMQRDLRTPRALRLMTAH
jgi:hypothetical protein